LRSRELAGIGRKGFIVSSSAPVGTATILVVDDDALITLNTADILVEMGHRALEAYSGREALEMLAAHPEIGLVITDYGMPGMNGAELAASARAVRPGLPVLLATGYAELPDGSDSDLPRLEKPFRQEELMRRIGDMLGPAAAKV
jgi:CheY-like chemotaxis protein